MARGLWRLASACGALLAHAAGYPTPGCSGARRPILGRHTLTVQDPALGDIERSYLLASAPGHGGTGGPAAPLVLGFHGQSGTPETWTAKREFEALAWQHGWAFVIPAGLRERGDSKDNDTTWNCGTGGDDSTCVPKTTGSNCMESCQRLGKCGRCNWSTCYNDVAFIEQMLGKLEQDLCLESRQYFVLGESNGAMFTHSLIQELPGRFLAAAPVFGSPLLGYLVGPSYELLAQRGLARRTSVLQLHGRNDTTIPWQGGKSEDGWLYEARQRALGVWAAVHGCAVAPGAVHTLFTGGPKNVACETFGACASGGRVMACSYDGNHGEWPDEPRAAQLVWNFFESVRPMARILS